MDRHRDAHRREHAHDVVVLEATDPDLLAAQIEAEEELDHQVSVEQDLGGSPPEDNPPEDPEAQIARQRGREHQLRSWRTGDPPPVNDVRAMLGAARAEAAPDGFLNELRAYLRFAALWRRDTRTAGSGSSLSEQEKARAAGSAALASRGVQALHHAFLAGIMIAQVGEFSFLLAVIAVDVNVISETNSRLIIAVTVMSLALSPLWVFTGRRVQLLVSYGVTEGRELMKLVYGPEVELVSDAIGGARTSTQRQLRRAAFWLRRRRLRRKREHETTQSSEADTPFIKTGDTSATVEILPPEKTEPHRASPQTERLVIDAGSMLTSQAKPAPKRKGATRESTSKTVTMCRGAPAKKPRSRPKPTGSRKDA